MDRSNLHSIFGEIRVDTSSAASFLRECVQRSKEGEQLDAELVLEEARNLITATIHPSSKARSLADGGVRVPANDKQDPRAS